MAIECARCGMEAPDETTECPDCGYCPQEQMRKVGIIIFVLGLIASLALIGIPIAIYGMYRFFKSSFVYIDSEYALADEE